MTEIEILIRVWENGIFLKDEKRNKSLNIDEVRKILDDLERQ